MNTAILNIERADAAWETQRVMTVLDARLTEAPKLKIAAYARVSSDSADQQGSYISQVRYYTQIIREKDGWEYVDIYADEGITGTSADKRDEFQRMMADCRKGKIDRILCKSVSRFARNFTDCVTAIRELHMMGVSVVFEKENIDTAKTGDDLMLSLQSLWAQRESISISGNMRRGVRMRMKTGTFLSSSTPFGYTLDLEGRTLAVAEEQAVVVRRIYATYLAGRGMQNIADELTRDSVPKRFGKDQWYTSTVFYILTNLSYTGDTVWQKSYTTDSLPFQKVINKGEKARYLVQNDHPAIISHEDFEKVQALMARRREKHGGGTPGEYILAGKVVCGNCGRIHRRKVVNGKVYWVCRRHDHGKVHCPVSQVPEAELHAAFARMWNKLYHHRQEILGTMLEQFQTVADRRYRRNDRIVQVNNELNALSEQAHVLNRLKSKGIMEPALYFDQIREMNAKIKDLRTLKAGLMERDQMGGAIAAIESLSAALEVGPEWMEEIDGELFDELVERITVLSPEQVKIKLVCGLELTENIQRTVK